MAKDKTLTPDPVRFQRSWRQWWQHLWSDRSDIAHVLDAEALTRLEARITASEQGHSGEIRLCVEAGLPLSYLRRGATPRERALAVFGKLRVWDTEANNGVLVYLLLAEHAIEIVADRGIDRHVDAAQWRALIEPMRAAFRAGRFEDGLAAAVQAIDALQRQHFPLAEGQRNPNELPDRPLMRGSDGAKAARQALGQRGRW